MKIATSTKSFYHKCVRVWHVMRKPTRKEFETVSKVSALGILALGVLGFLVSVIVNMFI